MGSKARQLRRLRPVVMRGGVADVYVEGEIGYETTAASFREQLAAVKDATELRVHINSEGGVVTQGMAIYSALRAHPARKVGIVTGLAASMASVILMACDERRVAKGALVMIHLPSGGAMGNADDMHKAAESLEMIGNEMLDLYEARTGIERKKLEKMLREETYFTAEEAVAAGIADVVETFEARISLEAVAKLDPTKIPAALTARAKGKTMNEEEMKARITALEEENAKLKASAKEDDEEKTEEEGSEDDDKEKDTAEDDEEEKKEAKALLDLVKSVTGSKTIAGATGKLAALISKGGEVVRDVRVSQVEAAIKSGKLIPAMKDWALSASDKAWKGYVSGIGGESVLKLGKRHEQPKAPVEQDGEPTAEELKVGKAMGLSRDQIIASRKLPETAKTAQGRI